MHSVDQHYIIASQTLSVDILAIDLEVEKQVASSKKCRTGLESIYIMSRSTLSLNLVFSAPIEIRDRVEALCVRWLGSHFLVIF